MMLGLFDKMVSSTSGPSSHPTMTNSISGDIASKLVVSTSANQQDGSGVVDGTVRRWNFTCSCATYPGESVAVTGDCDELGNWKHDKAFVLDKIVSPMDPEDCFHNQHGGERIDGVWTGEIFLPINKRIKYRYFICMMIDNPNLVRGSDTLYIMRRWESNPVPRLIEPSQLLPPSDPQQFGFIDSAAEAYENGWLTSESIIQFKLSNSPLRFWRKKHQNGKISMKMLALNLTRNCSSSEFPDLNSVDGQSFTNPRANDSWPLIECAVINEDEYQFKPQPQFGRPYNENEILIFQAQVLQLENVAYMIDFYMDSPGEDEIPIHIGFCHILPVHLNSTVGTIIQPITGMKQESIGQIMIEYIVVKPLESSPCDLSVSYSKHWKWNKWTGLDIGHRGSGNTQQKFKLQQCNNIRENTIGSLQKAADRGADFVEFDVQLSKDMVPVLFHDFHVNIGLSRKKKSKSLVPSFSSPSNQLGHTASNGNGNHNNNNVGLLTTLRLPMHALTIAQLHELRISHEHEEPTPEDEDDESESSSAELALLHEPFPTLQSALEMISIQTGFNIEVKWPMKLKDGTFELENPFELNTFLDIVLQTVLLHGEKRRIVFSCFHPDICVMIRLKQNKYPVLFLTQGVTSKYPEFNDPRTQTTAIAINFALFAGILGLNMHTEDILRDPNFVQKALSHGLVTFCWGEENNSTATIKYLKQLGVHGVVYDRIDEHMEQKQSVFLTTDEDNDFLQIASGLPIPSSTQYQDPPSSSTPSTGSGVFSNATAATF